MSLSSTTPYNPIHEYYLAHHDNYEKDADILAKPKCYAVLSVDTSGKLVERWKFSLSRLIDTIWALVKGYTVQQAAKEFISEAKVILGPHANSASIHVKMQSIATRAGITSSDSVLVENKQEFMVGFYELLQPYLDKKNSISESSPPAKLTQQKVMSLLEDRDRLTDYMTVLIEKAGISPVDDTYKIDLNLVEKYQEVSKFISGQLKERFSSPDGLDLNQIGKLFQARIWFMEKENSKAYEPYRQSGWKPLFPISFTNFERRVNQNVFLALWENISGEQRGILEPYTLGQAWMYDEHNFSSKPDIDGLDESYKASIFTL